ncbi:MAG: hypothetical protein ACRCY6_04430, partial [Bacteroidales bacterium]
PTITPLNFKHKGRLSNTSNRLRIKITDKHTEVNTYAGTIDGQWALFEYDEKNNLLYYDIDNTRVQGNKNHRINISATDIVGNIAQGSFEVFF